MPDEPVDIVALLTEEKKFHLLCRKARVFKKNGEDWYCPVCNQVVPLEELR